MTRDDVLRIGRQAGAFIELAQEKDLLWLERFAALVMEEDAKLCENEAKRALWNWENDISGNNPFWNGAEQLTSRCAAAIRARKP